LLDWRRYCVEYCAIQPHTDWWIHDFQKAGIFKSYDAYPVYDHIINR